MTQRLQRPITAAILTTLGIALALGMLGDGPRLKRAVYVPLPLYSIDAVSGSHHASLLNLPLGQPGAPVAPMPVDVDGDLLPDVAVSVNLVDIGGVNVPPSPQILAPTIRIDRLLTAVLTNKPSPPLRITANLQLVDVTGGNPASTFKFGYDTAKSGSIPGTFSAVVQGLTSGFDPMTVNIDTKGTIRGADPGPTHYQGPLTLLTGFDETGANPSTTALQLAYSPFPNNVSVGLESLPDGGRRITYSHGLHTDVDLTTTLDQVSNHGDDVTHIVGRIDRLPRNAVLDLKSGADSSGAFALTTNPDGRLPDVEVNMHSKTSDRLLNARAEIDGVPSHIEGEWALPPDTDPQGKARLRFEAPDGIGAVEATVNDSDHPTLTPFVPTESQYVNFQQTSDEKLITGRVESISRVAFDEVDRGFDASFRSVTGGRPLQLHASERGDQFVEASSLISQLPSAIDVHVRKAGSDETADPMSVTYDASTPVDVQAALEFHDTDAATTAVCGDAFTTCADLRVRQVPSHIETRVAQAGPQMNVDVELPQPSGQAPDIVADVTHGADNGAADARPIVAHLDALGVSSAMHAVFTKGADGTVEQASFDTDNPIQVLAFSVADFLAAHRPADIPPSLPIDGNGARVTARGRDSGVVDFEAIGRLVDVGGFRYYDKNLFGLHTQVGGNADLNVDVDARNVASSADQRVDVVGHALVHQVPSTLDICFRPDGLSNDPGDYPVDNPTLTPCVDKQPFDPEVKLDKSPLSIAYRASAPIDHIEGNVHVREIGDTLAQDHVTNGSFGADAVPRALNVFVLPPRTKKNPLAAQFDTGGFDPPGNLHAHFEDLWGDLQCEDPRIPAEGQHATCATVTVPEAPGKLRLDYNPDQATDNFSVTTDRLIDVNGLQMSSVERQDHKDAPATANVLVLTADVQQIGKSLTGTLHAPALPDDAPKTAEAPLAVDFTATPPIHAIDAHVRTYLGPDPFETDGAPAQRAGLPAIDPSFDTVTLLQAGDALRSDVHVTDFSGIGYRTGVDTDGFRYPSHFVDLRLGAGRSVRAYIDTGSATTNTENGAARADRTIVDLTAQNLPGDLTACFRGQVPVDPVAHPDAASYCDSAAGDKGAFQLTSDTPDGGIRPSVHAFFRSSTDSEAKVMSGRLDVDALPHELDGVIGDGNDGNDQIDDDTTAVVQALPDALGTIDAHFATFDINDEGWSDADRPFFRMAPPKGPFPVADVAGQQVQIGASGDGFEARARLGSVGGAPGSQLKKLSLSNTYCPQPAGKDDYPDYRDNPSYATTYTCAQLDVQPIGGADPIAIGLIKDKADGSRVALHDAGLSNVPDHVQVTMVDTSTTVPKANDPNEPLRERCGTVGTRARDDNACLPPQLRFDATGAPNAVLWGVLDKGTEGSIAGLGGVAATLVPDDQQIDATPNQNGWSDGTTFEGLRAKIATVGTEPDPAVRAALRLPLPGSVTVYPVQSWQQEVNTPRQGDTPAIVGSGRDLRVGYVARTPGGAVQDLGRLAVLYIDDAGNQTLLTDTAAAQLKQPAGGTDYTDLPPSAIPGELDVTVNLRRQKVWGSTFVNVVGRVNKNTNLRLQMQNAPEEEPKPTNIFESLPTLLNQRPEHPLRVDASIVNLPGPAPGSADDGSPTFKLRAEMLRAGDAQPGDPPPKPDECGGFFTDHGCVQNNIALDDLQAVFNFAPPNTVGARFVKAVFEQDGSTTGVAIQAFKDVNPPDDATPDGIVTAQVLAKLDPFNIVQNQEEYVLNIHTEIKSTLTPVMLLDRVSDVKIRGVGANLGVQRVAGLPDSSVRLIPLLHLDSLNANVSLDVYIGTIPLIGVKYIGGTGDLVNMKYSTCDDNPAPVTNHGDYFNDTSGFAVEGALISDLISDAAPDALTVHPGESATVLTMPDDGLASPFVIDVLGFFPISPAGPLMSIVEHWQLCKKVPTNDLIGQFHPGDPLPFAGHAIPDVPLSKNVDEGAGDPIPVVPSSIEAGQTVTVDGCLKRYTSLDIHGTLKTVNCDTHLFADDVHIYPGGKIEGNNNVTLFADSFTVDPGGQVVMNKGNLEVDTFGDLRVAGAVNANGSSTTAGSTNGFGGGGHIGEGGEDGNHFPGGSSFGNIAANDPTTEAGANGNGPQQAFVLPGGGGGAVTLSGKHLVVSGAVTADGTNGPDSQTTYPYGGGGGGAVVLMGEQVDLGSGSVHANGGNGGCGETIPGNFATYTGGGGGGGGIVKVIAGLLSGPTPPTPQPGAGSDCSSIVLDPSLAQPGFPGQPGLVEATFAGKSDLDPFASYWHSGVVNAYVTAQAPTSTFTVNVCGFKKDQPDGTDPQPIDDPHAMDGVGPASDANPCGTRFGAHIPVLGALQVTNATSVSHALVQLTNMTEGEWVLFTSAGSSSVAGQACPPTSGSPPSQCRYEPAPSFADDLIGVDNTAPVVTDPIVVGGGRWASGGDHYVSFTGTRDITIATSAVDQTDKANLSYLGCAESHADANGNSLGDFVLSSCVNDGQPHEFHLQTSGDGAKTIRVFAVDRAGNVSTLDTTVILDQTPPGSQSFINVFPDPDGANGWYKTPPNFSLIGSFDGFNSDGSEGSGGNIPAWAYRVDGNDEKPCPDLNVCSVFGEIPASGVHVVHFTPIDRVQNRLYDDKDPATPSPMFNSAPIKVDHVAPTTALLSSPAAPDGEHGWFVTAPWVTFLGTDKLDGSGLSGGTGTGIFYSVNGSTPTAYTAPFKLGEGASTVCWSAVDVAGNAESQQCQTFNVDTHDPSVAIAAVPAAPDTNGWYTASPTFSVSSTDTTAGVDPTSLVVSVDGGPLFTPTGSQSIPEGIHDVRARVRDNAGRYSAVALSTFQVDLSTPTVSHRILPPDPAQAGWYRRLPRVALVANDGDQSSGVDHIEYRIGNAGSFVTYTAPFELPEGRSTVTYRAVDRVGHVTPDHSFGVAVDVTSPVAKALTTSPQIWLRHLGLLGLGPKSVKLNYSVMDPKLPGLQVENEHRNLHVIVIVHDALGDAVRRIDAGTIVVAPGTTYNGSVQWDGTDQSLTGFLGVGTYYYRVIASDEAGNWTETGESQPLQIVL
ncbi:MAG TPA: hypothetical protein VHC63_07735 [Acidimicrobiales bacterium]|nr:hypothetical protein [Acidimicrobiales bacterium]